MTTAGRISVQALGWPADEPSLPATRDEAGSTHLAVPAGAAALRHALDLPGQGLVHQVGQGLLAEQAGPELHGERVCSRTGEKLTGSSESCR